MHCDISRRPHISYAKEDDLTQAQSRVRARRERSRSGAVEQQVERIDLEATVNNIIYIIGLIVVILAILSFFGLR